MELESFGNLAGALSGDDLGIGWLAGVSLLRAERAVRTDWHCHRDTVELLCGIRGETNYEFRDRPPVTLIAGSYLVIPRGVEHRVENAIDAPCCRLGLNLNGSCGKSRRFAVFEPKDVNGFRRRLLERAYRPVPCPREMKASVAGLCRLALRGADALSSVDWGYARLLCCTTLHAAVMPQAETAPAPTGIMDKAVEYLETRFAEDISSERLAAYMGYSRARLFVLFREHTGLTPNDCLQRIRIRRAKEMLANGDGTAAEIAAACGFADPGYFSRVFRRYTGLTPLAFRAAGGSAADQRPFRRRKA